MQPETMKLARLEPYFITTLIVIILLLNFSTFLYRSFTTPPGRTFLGTQFYSDDYAVYLSYILQGQQGRWSIIDKYTTDSPAPSFIHYEYLLWGKVTGLFHIHPIFAYHLFRLSLGLVFLVLIYLFLLRLFPQKDQAPLRLSAFALSLFSNGFAGQDGLPYLNWLTELDPAQRFAPLPHYLIGFICQIALFVIFLSTSSKKLLIPSLLLSAIASFVSPASFIVTIATLTLFTFTQSQKLFPKLLHLSFLAIAGLPAFLYYRYIFHIPPWSHILAFEQANKSTVPFLSFLLGLGPIAFLAPLSLFAFKRHKLPILFLFIWITITFISGFYLADFARLNPTRFFQNPVYIPLAILTILGLSYLLKKPVLLLAATTIIILITLPPSVISLKNHFRMYADYSELIYPTRELYQAINFLENHTQPSQPVMVFYQAGNMIPFLSGNTVYVGHEQETLDFGQKLHLASQFFSNQLSPDQAKALLLENRIQYVFYSPQERSYGGRMDLYPFLKPIYDQGSTTIYQFTND